MDKHSYIDNDHLAPPATPSGKHAILVSHLSRPRSRGNTSRRVHRTCASSTPTPHHHNRCQEPPAPLHERELSTAARSPPASQRTYLTCDLRHCCTNTVVCGSPLVVHVAEVVHGGCEQSALTSHARHTTQRGQCWVTRTSTSTGGRWRADARRAASPSGFRDAPRTSAERRETVTAGGWTELLEEPLRKVLEELLRSVHLRTEGVGARPRRRYGWCSLGGCLAMTRW